MFTTDQIPAGVLDRITAPHVIDVSALVATTIADARRLAGEITAGRDLTDHAKGDVYYGVAEALFNTLLDRIADRDGDDRARQLAAEIDAELDRRQPTA
jgi:hypothetical protein